MIFFGKNAWRNNLRGNLLRPVCAACLAALLFTGCSAYTGGRQPVPSAGAQELSSPAVAANAPALRVVDITAFSDPEVLTESTEDPYSLLDSEMLDLSLVDKNQYNMLYHAVENMEPEVDVSSFALSRIQLNNLIAHLDVNFRLFYLTDFLVSKDGKSVAFTYSGTREQISRDTETFHARLGHLLYDVAREDYSDLQKFLAVYDEVCHMSNYTAAIDDPNTWTPYSIVMNGQGLCSGYALLMRYVLNQRGIPAEYVCNIPHAWNLVRLGGNWYHSDATWGAGESGDTVNNLDTVLMDDTAREQSLEQAGYNDGEAIVGGYRDDAAAPPVCSDKRFSAYASVGCYYVLDTDGKQVYFSGNSGIMRMNLDCTEMETIAADVFAYQMVFFNGTLYYINGSDGLLYQLVPGGEPVLLDANATVTQLKLDNTTLRYALALNEKQVPKAIELLPLASEERIDAEAAELPGATVPRSSSFRFVIRFSQPVGERQNWNELVYLVGENGETIPLSFQLDASATVLTVRPKTCAADIGKARVLVKRTVASAEGSALAQPYRMNLEVKSGQ